MEFFVTVQEDYRITKVFRYTNGFKKKIEPFSLHSFEEQLHSSSFFYIRDILISSDTLFYKLEFPKKIKPNLQYIQIDNFITDTLEKNGLARSEYIFFFRDYPSFLDKKMKTSYIFVLPLSIAQQYSVQELYFAPFVFLDLIMQTKIQELFAIFYKGEDLIFSAIFKNRELEIFNISFMQDIHEEVALVKQIANERFAQTIEDTHIFYLHHKDSLTLFLQFLGYKSLQRQIEKLSHEIDPFVALTLFAPVKPIQERDVIRFFIDDKELKLVTNIFLVLIVLGTLFAFFIRYQEFLAAQKVAALQNDKTSLQIAINKLEKESRALRPYQQFYALLKKMPFPIYPELFYGIEEKLQAIQASLLASFYEKKRLKKRKKSTTPLKLIVKFSQQDDMKIFNTYLQTHPLIRAYSVELLISSPTYIAQYTLQPKKISYGN